MHNANHIKFVVSIYSVPAKRWVWSGALVHVGTVGYQ